MRTKEQTAEFGLVAENGAARNLDGKKERTNTLRILVYRPDEKESHGRFFPAIEARFWMGRSRSASVVYCSVWIRPADDHWRTGYGTAGGYGYHKESAALDEALNKAGVRLGYRIHGAGHTESRLALDLTAVAAGWGDFDRHCLEG